ncbi:MAG: GTP 3',8-cyclase MoaA [Deltaproteobacteria bacterium]|nr:GTP 3',8-cyclase MoaA [Deltaproteobacteria bacterium]
MPLDRLIDQYARTISTLRLSVTDRCDLKCLYCTPPNKLRRTKNTKEITRDEIRFLVRIFGELGIKKIRLTGGEPLMRSDIVDIVKLIADTHKGCEIVITTNASKLTNLARPLKMAGLHRVNISLDSLSPETFQKTTRSSCFADVMKGIDQAFCEGLKVKINVVALKGINDHEINPFINFALDHPVDEIRFIEFMPLCGPAWHADRVLPLGPVIERVKKEYQTSPHVHISDHVSESFNMTRGSKQTRVGFIRSLSNPFCKSCSRIRITAAVALRTCLFSHRELALRPLLKKGGEDLVIKNRIQDFIWEKESGSDAHQMKNNHLRGNTVLLKRLEKTKLATPHIRQTGG